jgi:hypothetical protein
MHGYTRKNGKKNREKLRAFVTAIDRRSELTLLQVSHKSR